MEASVADLVRGAFHSRTTRVHGRRRGNLYSGETRFEQGAVPLPVRRVVELEIREWPVWQADNAASAASCEKCNTPFPLSDATISPSEYGQAAGWSAAVALRPSSEAAAKGQLKPGSMLGDRYEILQLLGQGVMRAVYNTRAAAHGRTAAIELVPTDPPTHPAILAH